MTRRNWYASRLVHSCTITRDTGTAQSASGEPEPVGSAVSSTQACRYTEQSRRYGNEHGGFVFVSESWLLLPYNADVQVGDVISSVVDADSASVVSSSFDVDELLARRDIGASIHHKSAKLVKVEVG